MKILIKNGRILDPHNNIDCVMDLLIEDNLISKVEKDINEEVDKTIDATNKWVTPGLIDLHVHLREPGFEKKETIKTGTQSAAIGGFTTICAMPNTNPVVDNEILVEYIKMKAKREGIINVLPVGSITKGQKGEELSNIGKMAEVGVIAISEDGRTVENSALMKTALKYAKMFDIPVLSHCEDCKLTGKGQINASDKASLLGLKGIPDDSEDVIVSRDIILSASVKSALHICHVSTKGSVRLIKEAKLRGEKVTGEVTPHHFTLTDSDIKDYDTNYKMSPPLRSIRDLEAIKQALKEDIIDVIATDHAPHHIDDKNCEFENASNGIVGLETALCLGVTELVEKNILSPLKLIEKMTINPAKIIKIDKGTLSVGKIADITVIDPIKEYTINIKDFVSKSKNSPFDGYKVKGKVTHTIVNGNLVVEDEKLV